MMTMVVMLLMMYEDGNDDVIMTHTTYSMSVLVLPVKHSLNLSIVSSSIKHTIATVRYPSTIIIISVVLSSETNSMNNKKRMIGFKRDKVNEGITDAGLTS